METIEITAPTVQEAVDTGMAQLDVSSPSQVMVEVLQEPDQGIMGQGARPAIVRLIFMGTRPGDKPATSIMGHGAPPEAAPVASTPISSYDPDDEDFDEDEDGASENEDDAEVTEEDAQVGKQVLQELLDKMGLDGIVEITQADATRPDENTHWVLNIDGKDTNRLIGKRGETLASLQYITRLIVSRKLQRRANLIVDAGGYKAKRSDRLRGLANRMADQAVRQKRTITLEPMPPHERRIIHLTLRKRNDVTTKSVGDGDNRKVTIEPA